jgi:hypothetical protein
VRFAEQGFADHADRNALGQRLNRCAQSGTARADHQYIVLVRFKTIGLLGCGAQKILTS